MKTSLLALLLALTLSSVVQAQEGVPRMRVADCVLATLRDNPDVKIGADEIAASRASRSEVGGQFGPRIRLEGSLQQWNSPFDIPFQLSPTQPPANFPVRDALTWNFSASAIQPITGLLAYYELYRMRDIGVDVAMIRQEATRRDVGFRTIEAFYRLLQVERLLEVASKSVEELEAQLKRANAFHDSGTVSKDDVLRAELAVANAKQRVIVLRAQGILGRSRLAVAMGRSPDAEVDAEHYEGEPAPIDMPPLERAEEQGVAERVELREVDRHIEQSKSNVRISWLKMGPQLNFVASYQHNEGSQFILKDSEFIGGTLSWDVWDWGTSIAGVNEANAKMRQARTARKKIEDQVRLEVRQAFLTVGTAREAMTVAKAAVASAEENFRLVQKRYEANTATSFDVIDAEGVLTQSRGQFETAKYDYLIAGAALRRAMGASAEHLVE
jgi:outer membrane protein